MRRTPVAIVGIGCRFPGAHGPDEFWWRLRAGYDAIREIPADRTSLRVLHDPEFSARGRNSVTRGAFLTEIDKFEPEFFGIPPSGARRMDPQQRLLLETAWEALEDAGQPPEELAGSRTGVFVGQVSSDYWELQCREAAIDVQAGTSGARCMLSGVLSYTFDLQGPSVALDTGCSGSVLSVRQACQSLWDGESTMALAGGVNLLLSPETFVPLSQAGLLARDGRTKFGDAGADGYGRSEGAGLLVLKPLDRALADADRVYALLLGGAVNNDGRAAGYLGRPSVRGQADVLRAAMADAGVSPADIDYVEAHGAGTTIGDPIEFEALGAVLGENRPGDRPCLIGSVKTNIGHTEGAAGVAGLIKAALCLHHGMVPPSLHLREPNPEVPWDTLPLEVRTELAPLPARDRPRLAGVSSFGVSSTNAHLVLSEAEPPPRGAAEDNACLLTLSAHTPRALVATARAHAEYLAGAGRDHPLPDVCHSASRRQQHTDRLAVAGGTHDEVAATLRAFADGSPGPATFAQGRPWDQPPRIAFVFPGHGAQWPGMGRELLASSPVFRAALEDCDRAVRAQSGWSLMDELAEDKEKQDVEIVQPMLWATEVALAAVWRSWGVEPDVVIGHSMGEVAAAQVAGALTCADAAAVICHRSRLAGRLRGRGTMLSVALSAERAAETIATHPGRVSVAASNSPTATVLSGETDALAEIHDALRAEEVPCRWVEVNFAAHSAQVDAVREELLRSLAGLRPRPAEVAIRSTVLNGPVEGTALDAEYWVRNLREPVRFASAVGAALEAGPTVFVEIGPHPVLVSAIEECLEAGEVEGAAVHSVRRGQPERAAMLNSLGFLHTRGQPINWDAVHGERARLVSLPTYRWQRESYWFRPERPPPAPPGGTGARHPLLPAAVPAAGREYVWEGPLDRIRNGYLEDHRVQGVPLFPGTAYCELLVAATREAFGGRPVTMTGFDCRKVLVLRGDETPVLRVRLRPESPESPENTGTWRLDIHSRADSDDSWTPHVSSRVHLGGTPIEGGEPVDVVRARCTERVAGPDFYRRFAKGGNEWRARFQGIAQLWRRDGEALAHIVCPAELADDLDDFHFHPALLDACGQALAAAGNRPDAVFVLGEIARARVHGKPGRELWSHVKLDPAQPSADSVLGEIRVWDAAGKCVVELGGVRGRYLAETAFDDWLYEPRWEPKRRDAGPESPPGAWLLFADAGGLARRLRERLERAGHSCVTVAPADSPEPADHRLDPGDVHQALPGVLRGLGDRPMRGVVHLWNLDAARPDTATPDEIARAELTGCTSVVRLVQGLTARPESTRLWLVTRSVQAVTPADPAGSVLQAPVWGLGRTLAEEHPELRCTLVDLEDGKPGRGADSLFAELTADDPENQLALRGDDRFVARLARYRRPSTSDSERPVRAPGAVRISAARGVLDEIAVEDAPRRHPRPGEVEIEVAYAGLNYADLLCVLGMAPIPAEAELNPGSECSGTITAVGDLVHGLAVGDEVIAFGELGLGSHVLATAQLVFRRPARLGLPEAATVPGVFLTAYHSLCHLAGLGRGDRILIHTATGGVGLAAVQIARWKGAEIFATAGSPEKRALLRTMGIRHVADSRSLDFAEEFLAATHGQGVDVVLNTLAGPAIQRNLELLAPYGRYLELTKKDIVGDGRLALRALGRNISFHVVDVADMGRSDPKRVSAIVREVLRHLETGDLAPLPYRTFPAGDAAGAFRHLARAKHIGKVLLSFQDETAAVSPPAARPRRAVVRPDATYLVTGGLGGIGAKIAEWLADRGARYLFLLGRSPLDASADQERVAAIEAWKRTGAEVRYEAVDVADEAAMRSVLDGIARRGWPPIRGVLHAAGVHAYHPIGELDAAKISAVLRPKVTGSLVLDRLLRGTPLDFFVLFSSASALLSSPLLGGYAAANAFLDGLAHHRRRRGEPATSVNWGAWASVGMASRALREANRSLPAGTGDFEPATGLAILERLLGDDATQAAALVIDWPEWSRAHPRAARSPLLARLVPRNGEAEATPVAPPRTGNGGDRREVITRYLVDQLAAGLGMPPERIDLRRPLNRLGLDSLTAVELKNRVSRDLGVTLPVVTLLSDYTLAELIDQAADGERL
ncbi:type I polyketide synthase [Amycolatopsis anabasis]|uniref:type I polyketide synthase n=1 Tax=Amycolatopsis anabasis TaxID=1840409 RepID=UPI00131C5F8A|nr:type I polyketide synthase [Amycolatopsis anabasis]